MNHFKEILKPVLVCLLSVFSFHAFSQDKDVVSLSTLNVVSAPGMNIYNIMPLLDAREQQGHTQIAFYITGSYVSAVPPKIKPEAKVIYNISALRQKLQANNWTKIKFEIITMSAGEVSRYVSTHSGSADSNVPEEIKSLVIVEARSGNASMNMNANGLDMVTKICPPPLNCDTKDPSTE